MISLLGNYRLQEVKKRLKKLLHSRRAVVLGIGVAVLLIAVVFGIHSLILKAQPSDSDRANDLAKIETAVIASRAKSNHLPESLHLDYVGLTNLKGKIDDYTYNPDPHEAGAPTESYTTCATFRTQTIKLPAKEEAPSSDGGAQAYMSHRKGKQCFRNDYYKGSSHIALVYNYGDIIAPKVSLNDAKVGDFVSKTETYYIAQRKALGSPGVVADLRKNCVKTKPQNTLYKDPYGNLYRCKIFYDSPVLVSGTSTQITSLLDAFVSTAKSEGFSVQDTINQSNAAVQGDAPFYHWISGFGGGEFGCTLTATYVIKAPQTEIAYGYACMLSDLKNLPSGFTVVGELTGP